MKEELSKFKKGAASFYIVAISTLILVIIAASFAAVIISVITRTSNDDLAQSAYDSALAGVEDAKLAYYNYQNCKNGAEYSNTELTCKKMLEWVENGKTPNGYEDCDMVAAILGRKIVGEEGNKKGVLVQEGESNDMQQYYTCVTMTNKTKDIKSSVSDKEPYIVRPKFDKSINEDVIKNIQKLRLKWHSVSEDEGFNNTDFENFDKDGIFREDEVTPAVISVGMIQTSKSFNLSDFNTTQGDKTDRGTLYLVPTMTTNPIRVEGKYNAIQNGKIDKNGFLKSNDKTSKNLPYAVYCNDKADDYACSVDIEIPSPVGGGDRNEDTFMFVIGLPYGGPSTHFSLEFFCSSNNCSRTVVTNDETGETTEDSNLAVLNGVQIKIDSTGRANDLYRRVETRLEPDGDPYPLYGIQVLGGNKDGSSSLIEKNLTPTSEYNFKD